LRLLRRGLNNAVSDCAFVLPFADACGNIRYMNTFSYLSLATSPIRAIRIRR
jgi:hypothetical protein